MEGNRGLGKGNPISEQLGALPDDLHLKFGVAKHHKKRHRQRPCGNPPAVPGGINFTVFAHEASIHLRFRAKLKWNEVTQDEQGHGTHIKSYIAQIIACDSGGTPIDTLDSRAKIYQKVKQPPFEVAIKDATNPSGTTYRFVTRKPHGQTAGNNIKIKDCNPQTAYNGSYTVDTVVNSTTLEVTGASSGVADCESPGTLVDDDDTLHIITHVLPRPKTWYWKARIRSVDKDNCRGDWSAWTTPILPWTGADPQPPVPTFGSTPISFDHVGKGKHRKIRLLFTFDEVVNFDYPGTVADDESDVKAYGIQIDSSTDGVNWDAAHSGGFPYITHHKDAKDADADTTVTAVFHNIHRHLWYRCRVRCVDRFNRKSDWSSWCTEALPFDDTAPPTPLNVTIYDKGTDRIIVEWDPPTIDLPTRGTVSGTSGTNTLTGTGTKFTLEIGHGSTVKVGGNTYVVRQVATDTSLTLTTNLSTSPSGARLYEVEEDPDVAFYGVQIAQDTNVTAGSPDIYDAVYKHDRVTGYRKSFKVADADKGGIFYGRVRTFDAARNRSDWIDATTAGNSSASVGGSAVQVGSGGGGFVIATFRKVGRLRAKHYTNARWTNKSGQTLNFVKARATVGYYDDATSSWKNVPTGSSLIINLRRWLADDSGWAPIFDNGAGGDDDTRFYITAGSHKDFNPPSTFNIDHLDDDEYMTVNVAQVGSTYPGADLTIEVWMVPA